MGRDLKRLPGSASAPDQPDPWEPSEEMIVAAQVFVDAGTRSLSTPDETFIECLACNEVDGHADTCPIASTQAWLASVLGL